LRIEDEGKIEASPHSAVKSLGSDVVKLNGFVPVHSGFLEVATERGFKHAAGHGKNKLVALEFLKNTCS